MTRFTEADPAAEMSREWVALKQALGPSSYVEGTRERSEQALRALASTCAYDSRTLASALGISQRQLQRLFKRQFGCTPQAWLQAERLETARQMLCGAASVKEVAYTLGFPQLSQFSRDFKRHFGVTPSACAPGLTRRSW